MDGSEPVTAFFPAIDRNLMRDLDRHLRSVPNDGPASDAAPAETSPVPEMQAPLRPDIAGVVQAVEQAASSMAAMAEHIQSQHERLGELDTSNQALTVELANATHGRDVAETALRAEQERGHRLETLAAHHVSRATALERELDLARADLAKVVAAITRTLGTPA